MPKHTTRESWLKAATELLAYHIFAPVGAGDGTLGSIPPFRVACGFPGGGSARKRIGECWSERSSADGTTEMIISPVLDDVIKVLGVLAHEMVHMYVGVEHGHKAPFRKLATAIGLTGKMTATEEGPEFIERAQWILDRLGEYPHAKLSLSGREKKKTYLLKAECSECGCTFRITDKWAPKDLAGYAPMVCPVPDCGGEVAVG